MSINHLLIVTSEPKSVFLELLFKYFMAKKIMLKKKKIILIGNIFIISKEAKKFHFKKKFNQISNISEAKTNVLNIINVKCKNLKKNTPYNFSSYINNSFNTSLNIIKKNKNIALFNGPINKKNFLKKKYLGITEFLAHKTKSKFPVMLIYNRKISVSPITTHLPIKYVSKHISKKKIVRNIKTINNFYISNFKIKPKIAVLGLNPHCETIDKDSEERSVIIPAIRYLKNSKVFVEGPFSADTFFIKKNIDKYDIVVGMYHDQVLTPLKTLFNFNAINITIGLPFIRVSPDHGPNSEMFGKNKSDPSSIFCAMEFFAKI